MFPLRPRSIAILAVVAAAAALAWESVAVAGQPRAGDTREMLRDVQRTLEGARQQREKRRHEAKAYAAELVALKRRLVIAARRAQDHEVRMSGLESRIAGLHAEESKKSRALRQGRRQLARMLAALQRLARHPPFALVALPASPTDTVRSAILLRGAVPRVEARAMEIKNDLHRLAGLRSDIAREQKELAEAGKALDRERRELASLIDRKTVLERSALAESGTANTRISKLASQARNLKDLIDKLAAARKRQRAPVAKPDGGIRPSTTGRLPALGRIVQQFGRSDNPNVEAKGVTIRTRPAARVVSPAKGEVVFAGPFRGYGQLLIIEHDGGYHVLLAGLTRVDAVVGDEVLEGEPVGVMNLSAGAKPKLYFELRRNGHPVNPLPWLAAGKDKVSG